MATTTTAKAQTSTDSHKAFEDKIKAQVQDAKSRLDQIQASAKAKAGEAETTAASHLTTAKQEIDRKLQDLKTTHDTHVARAKSDIEADVATFKAAVAAFETNIKNGKK